MYFLFKIQVQTMRQTKVEHSQQFNQNRSHKNYMKNIQRHRLRLHDFHVCPLPPKLLLRNQV